MSWNFTHRPIWRAIWISHIKKSTFKCCECGENFKSNYNLEQNLIVVHKKEKIFKCDKCSATFLVKFRLVKHKNVHDKKNTRTCHYHNNKKACPFEISGCKFAHVTAEKCKYQEDCRMTMCQFRHWSGYKNYFLWKTVISFVDSGHIWLHQACLLGLLEDLAQQKTDKSIHYFNVEICYLFSVCEC